MRSLQALYANGNNSSFQPAATDRRCSWGVAVLCPYIENICLAHRSQEEKSMFCILYDFNTYKAILEVW
jgi:hypothetical protein